MKIIPFFLFFSIGLTKGLFAKNNNDATVNAERKIGTCCVEASNFTEAFTYREDFLYQPSKDKISRGLQLATLAEEGDQKRSIQQLLQVGNPNDSQVVKNWLQDWIYENTSFYMISQNNRWRYVFQDKKEVKDQSAQKIFKLSRNPRLEGAAS